MKNGKVLIWALNIMLLVAVIFFVTIRIQAHREVSGWAEPIKQVFRKLETTPVYKERFVNAEEGRPLIELVAPQALENKNLKGITHTSGIVFLCFSSEGGDTYKAVAPMGDVLKWFNDERDRRLWD